MNNFQLTNVFAARGIQARGLRFEHLCHVYELNCEKLALDGSGGVYVCLSAILCLKWNMRRVMLLLFKVNGK